MNGLSEEAKQNKLVKLTGLYYKIKPESLEKYHNITEHNAGLLHEWEQSLNMAKSVGGSYPKKPFIEPFEFKNDDYTVEEKRFRITLKDIVVYKENLDGVTELTVSDGTTFSIKQKVEEIDKFFE